MPYVIVFGACLVVAVKDLNAAHGADLLEHDSIDDISGQLLLKWPVYGPAITHNLRFDLVQVFDSQSDQSNSRQVGDTLPLSAIPTFRCADAIGKVFDDSNLSGYQDEGEVGLPSITLVTARGLEVRTDSNGRFHITCVLEPNPDRGSNFIIKLDERSLPVGYRLTTENPRVERATPGKILKVDFGAAIHRTVRLDLADAVFETDSTQIRERWYSQIDLLMDKLVEVPAVLCLAYTAEFEDLSLVKDRLQVIKREIERRWADLDCCYSLDVETKIIWRMNRTKD
jgi:hypothetical protein